jgi:hypothetical protein
MHECDPWHDEQAIWYDSFVFFCLSHPIAFIQIQAIAYVQLLFKAHLFMCV